MPVPDLRSQWDFNISWAGSLVVVTLLRRNVTIIPKLISYVVQEVYMYDIKWLPQYWKWQSVLNGTFLCECKSLANPLLGTRNPWIWPQNLTPQLVGADASTLPLGFGNGLGMVNCPSLLHSGLCLSSSNNCHLNWLDTSMICLAWKITFRISYNPSTTSTLSPQLRVFVLAHINQSESIPITYPTAFLSP